MFYALNNAPSTVQTSLTTLPLSEDNFPPRPQKPQNSPHETASSGQKRSAKGNKRAKNKKSAADDTSVALDGEDDDGTVSTPFQRLNLSVTDAADSVWAALANSDSDFSDAERSVPSTPTNSASGPQSRRCSSARIRLHALSCFNVFVKVCNPKVLLIAF